MNDLVLTLTPAQAAHYIRSYSYDILNSGSSDSFTISKVKEFISSIKNSKTIIDILYLLLTDYANEFANLSDENKQSSLYYNLGDFIQFHPIFSTMNKVYEDDYDLKRMLLTMSDMAHVDQHTTVINWLEFYNV